MTFTLFQPFGPRAALAPILGVAAVALVLGCQTVVPIQPAPTAAPAARVVEFQASEYTFNAPDTLPAGRVTIRLTNHGVEPHHGQLMRLNDGVTFDQFTSALQAEGDAAIRFVSLEGGPGAIDPHGSSEVTLDLKPGAYVLACFVGGPDGIPHLAKGMLKPIQVTPSDAPASSVAESGATFTMRDFSFSMPETLPAGVSTYKVVNAGPQAHELNILKLNAGVTEQDLFKWDEAPNGPPPFEMLGGINGLSASGSGYMTLDLTPGTYLAICHIPDPTTGIDHAHLGMIKRFTVPG
jgi:hypothetical protein